jgi:hypothetical protein
MLFYNKFVDKNLSHMKNIVRIYSYEDEMPAKSHKNGPVYAVNGEFNDSQFASIPPHNPPEFCVICVKGVKFIRLEKDEAPAGCSVGDRRLVELALDGVDLDDIVRQIGGRAPEISVRLVQLRVGRLGCIRPADETVRTSHFEDVPLPPSRVRVPQRQPPILSLAARAFDGALQRLGDRLYVDGEHLPLPEIVRRARGKGVRIRYPRLDPLNGAWKGGPSRRDPRNRVPVNPWEAS